MTKHEYIVRISARSKSPTNNSILMLELATVREFASLVYSIKTTDISKPKEHVYGVRISGLALADTTTQASGAAQTAILKPLPQSGKITVVIELTTHRAEWKFEVNNGAVLPVKGFQANQGFIAAEVL